MGRRPGTVWIVQIIVCVVLLTLVVGGALGFWNILSKQTAYSPIQLVIELVFFTARLAAILALPFLAFRGLQHRKAYGRWLGLLILIALLGEEIAMHPNPFSLGQDDCGKGPLPCFQYSNPDQEMGAATARILIEISLFVLISRMAFAKSVKAFFQAPVGDEPIESPETAGPAPDAEIGSPAAGSQGLWEERPSTMADLSVPTSPEPEAAVSAIYFPVSLTKLLVMSFCTFGIYETFWLFSHWYYVKENEKQNISLTLRLWLAIFFCYPLFRKIRATAKSESIAPSFPALLLASGWIIFALLANLQPLSLLYPLSVLFLLPVQRTVNAINESAAPEHDRNARFTAWNKAAVVVGGLTWLSVILALVVAPK
jgi:hypothetical protein